jgi:hypothetical protein
MRRAAPLLATLALLAVGPAAHAIDHDNIDAGRPLKIEDADAIAFRERALEVGAAPTWTRGGSGTPRGFAGVGLSVEYLYGFAFNTHLNVGLDPYAARRVRSGGGSAGRHIVVRPTPGAGGGTGVSAVYGGGYRFEAGELSLGVFHNFNRETLATPAYAVRADVHLPLGGSPYGGPGFRLRGILSRTFAQYNRLHVNADAHFETDPPAGERRFLPALTVGVSRPLGLPTRFDRTVLAELGARASEEEGRGTVFHGGVGLRQQVTPRSVFDAGLTADFAATDARATRESLRLVAGYSTQF